MNMKKTNIKNKVCKGKVRRNNAALVAVIESKPDKDKKEQHLAKMLRVFQEAAALENAGIIKLEDDELELSAAYSNRVGLTQKCLNCGGESSRELWENAYTTICSKCYKNI